MEAVILIGIQGAGKTTFYQERFEPTHMRISLDLLKTRYREKELLRSCLADRRDFVVDNTNVRAAERAVYIAAARQAGFEVTGYFFDAAPRDALRRNLQRTGKEKIPPAGVMGTWKRLERPRIEEGFDHLWVVSRDASDRFLVRELAPEEPKGASHG
jgi:predicted kinase